MLANPGSSSTKVRQTSWAVGSRHNAVGLEDHRPAEHPGITGRKIAHHGQPSLINTIGLLFLTSDRGIHEASGTSHEGKSQLLYAFSGKPGLHAPPLNALNHKIATQRMDSQIERKPFDSAILADRLWIISIALFSIYALTILSTIFPFSPLDSIWQLRFTKTVLDGSAIPLVALGLFHLAAYLDPGNRLLQARCNTIARWATMACIGFLLLIPLQGFAAWKTVANANSIANRQLSRSISTFNLLRQTINSATSIDNLQARLQSIEAPGLGVRFEDPNLTDLPRIKRQLLSRLDDLQQQVQSRFSGPDPKATEGLIKDSLRVMISAAALAIAFAAGAQRKGCEVPLLVEVHTWWTLRGVRRPQEPAAGLAGLPILGPPSPREEDYFERLVPQDHQDPPTEAARGPEERS